MRERLAQAHLASAVRLLALGFELFCEPDAGMFLWAMDRGIASGAELSYKAAEQNMMLGPGHLFSTGLAPSPG